MVYLVQCVCLSDGVNLKVVATSIAEIERPVYHDVRNSMPHPTLYDRQLSRALAPSFVSDSNRPRWLEVESDRITPLTT